MLEEVTAVAAKRVIAWQIKQEMSAQKMRTSRAPLNRLLDENDTSLTLITLAGWCGCRAGSSNQAGVGSNVIASVEHPGIHPIQN
jgi:hypothetical protein